jgi:hypothetical protein
VAVINKDSIDKPIRSPVAGLFIVNAGGSRGGYNAGIDIIGDAVESCDKRVTRGSMPSLKSRIASPQSPLLLLTPLLAHSAVNDGVVIEAR